MNEKLSDPKKTIEVIQKYQFAFQKRFGQNFLIDAHVLEKIVSAAGITKDDCWASPIFAPLRCPRRYPPPVPTDGGY